MKKATLISFILFIGLFIVLAFFAPAQNPANTGIISQTAKNGTNPNSSPSTLTKEEVAKHNTPNDCYLIVNGVVYNVSSYLGEHPGGVRSITSRCGQEATKIFSTIHSNFAWNLLKKFYVGDLGKNTTGTIAPVSQMANSLQEIQLKLKKIYPNAEIVDIKPKSDFFVAKIIKNNALYEIHIDKQGKVIKEEVQNDELDWSAWNNDEDD